MRVSGEFWVPLRLQNDDQPLPEKHPLRVVFEAAGTLAAAIVLMVGMTTFLVKPVRVYGDSMLPTLRGGQRLVISVCASRFRHGDIVVVSGAGHSLPYRQVIIKRVIGLPGDVIDIDFEANAVYRNGQALEEPYIAEPTERREDFDGPVTVKPGAVFVLGDNRNRSTDSRSALVGLVDQRCILGRVMFK